MKDISLTLLGGEKLYCLYLQLSAYLSKYVLDAIKGVSMCCLPHTLI